MTGFYVIPVDKLEHFVQGMIFSSMPMSELTPELPGPIRDALREMAIVPPEECRDGGSAAHITFEPSVWDAVDPTDDLTSWDCPDGAPCTSNCELGSCAKVTS